MGAAQRALPGGVRMICVYLLKSIKDAKQYIGSTDNLHRRLEQHTNGAVHSTKNRRPFILIGFQQCATIGEARYFEHKYKKSHGALERAIKNKLFTLIGM